MEAQTQEKQKATAVQQIGSALHDLCQPLTAIQCRLEMAELMNTCDEFREAVALGISECARMASQVHRMRELLKSLVADSQE